jgi:predicted acylesterase/phospholipase RssA
MASQTAIAPDSVAVNTGPARLECDLVMKGGITSGVIYPRLVSELSKTYTLRNIGGTSAGAIAAGAAAAAQFGVLSGARPDAFKVLDGLPALLGGSVANAKGSMLLNLFQPQAPFRRHFGLLTAALNAPSKAALIARIIMGAAWRFPIGALLGATIGIAILATSSGAAVWLGVVVAILGLVLGGLVSVVVTLVRHLPGNGFGLCSGMPAGPQGPPALTSWLHEYLNGLAGKKSDEPVTFGELWAGYLRKQGEPSPHNGDGRKEIELVTITTALNLGRPFRLPFDQDKFYFVEEELRRLFPGSVAKWLVDHARPSDTAAALSTDKCRFLALPLAQDLPVLLAVRMSLSFPILLSTIPLYTVDRTLKENSHTATVPVRVLFSDGGICSNFPMHLFDSPLPSRPTFGVDLGDFHEDHPGERVWLPATRKNSQGIETFIPVLSEQPGVAAVAGFFGSMMNTMQTWNDQLQLVMPGFRDRIVHISHSKKEGGLNLNMESAVIQTLATSGLDAARELVEAFVDGSEHEPNAWDNHRRVRMRLLLSAIDQQTRKLHQAMARTDAPTWREVLDEAKPPSYPFHHEEDRALANKVLYALDAVGREVEESGIDLGTGAPRPEPEWRGTPRF